MPNLTITSLKEFIIKNYFFVIFGAFVLLHVIFLNINSAEWGDSYRILRASEFIRQGTYPTDEKRPPLFSLLLSIRPSTIEPVLAAKIFMFGLSIVFFILFYKFVCLYTGNNKIKALSLILLTLNPVFFYWSIRIYADLLFAFLALSALYIIKRLVFTKRLYYAFLLALICILAIFTRFEGYILTCAVFGGLLFLDGFKNPIKIAKLFNCTIKNCKIITVFSVTTLVILMPYLYLKNPFSSSYFEEPAQRVYSLETFLTYIASFIFLFGFTSSMAFVVFNIKETKNTFRLNTALFFFVAIEATLALVWPAAIPRLFVPIVPFFCVFISTSVVKYFDSKKHRININLLFSSLTLLFAYVLIQYYLKLQFLITVKYLFLLIILLQIPLIYFTYKKHFTGFVTVLCLSMLLWATAIIYMHKDIYKTLKEGATYVSQKFNGAVLYNDTSSVSDWYLNYSFHRASSSGVYISESDLKDLKKDPLYFSVLIVSNETSPSLEFKIKNKPYLHLDKEFSEYTNGKQFWTRIYTFER